MQPKFLMEQSRKTCSVMAGREGGIGVHRIRNQVMPTLIAPADEVIELTPLEPTYTRIDLHDA
jgi:hypothetical protein